MKKILVLITLTMAGMAFAATPDYTGIVYAQGSGQKEILYHFSAKHSDKNGKEDVLATFSSPDGQEAVRDEAVLDGSNVIRDEIHQDQTGQSGLIEVKNGRVYFSKTVDGKTSTSDEKLGDTFVISANFQRFIKDHWKQISEGKTVSFRYGVWDRKETVGFEIFKNGEEKQGDQKILVLKMKPSSFLIAALVKPLYFRYPEDGAHLLEMNGRVPPKTKSGSSWKDLDAEVVYSYSDAAPVGATVTTTTLPKK
jgi:hypothetical protein